MAQLQAFPRSGKDDAVLADHVAAAQRGEADGSWLAFAGDTLPGIRGVPTLRNPPSRRRFAQPQRRAGRRVGPCPGCIRRFRCRLCADFLAPPPARYGCGSTFTPTLMLKQQRRNTLAERKPCCCPS